MVLFSKEASEKVGEFSRDNPYLVDLDYWVRILAHGDGFALNLTVGAFRIADGSASIRIVREQAPLFRKFLRALKEQGLIKLGPFELFLVSLRSAFLAGARALIYFYLKLLKI
jgi:hypothetical protein